VSVARELLSAVVAELQSDPKLASQLRELLGVPTPKPAPEVLYERVAPFAKRVSLSERTVWGLVAKGLPTIGSGRSRRVDVAKALAWMHGQRDAVDDALEKQARAAAAKRAAKQATR